LLHLVPIPITQECLTATSSHWMPFLPSIARRSKQTVSELIRQAVRGEVRMTLVWEDTTDKAQALVGVRMHMRGPDLIAEIVWATGRDHKAWIDLLPELEAMLKQAGAVECRPICRPGWSKALKARGYRLTHLQMEKVL